MQILLVVFDIIWLGGVLGTLLFIAIGGHRYFERFSQAIGGLTEAHRRAAARDINTVREIQALREYLEMGSTAPRRAIPPPPPAPPDVSTPPDSPAEQ